MTAAVQWFAEGHRGRSGDFRVRGIGIGESLPPCLVDRPDGTPEWLLVHFHDPAEIQLDGNLREHPADTLVIWPARSLHLFGHRQRRWRHSWLLCDGPRASGCIGGGGLPPQQVIAQVDGLAAMRYLRLLRGEIADHQPPSAAILEGLLALWLREAERAAALVSGDAQRPPERMLAVRRSIEADPTRPLGLVALARQANLSVSRLSVEFRRCFGLPPIRYANELRLKQAVFLMSDRNLSIKQVAARCGFADQRYFARVFRARFGRAPRESRG